MAELTGYYPLDTEIDVSLSPDQTIQLEMVRLPGLVTLTTEPEAAAEVRVDGEPFGTTPLVDAEIMTGRHQIEFVAERYLTEVRELDVIGGGERQRLPVELTPNWAPITVETDPPGAAVFVDGNESGSTPLVVELSAGERIFEIRLGGYNPWADVVSVLADQPQTVRVLPIAVHPFIMGQPHRFPYFVKMLEHLKNQPGVVFMTATQIYEWYEGQVE